MLNFRTIKHYLHVPKATEVHVKCNRTSHNLYEHKQIHLKEILIGVDSL